MEKKEMINGQSVSVKPYEIIDTINNKRYHTWKWYKLNGLFAVAHKLFKNIAWQLTYSEGGRVMTISKKA